VNDGGVQARVCQEHGRSSLIAGDSYLPADRWPPLDGKGVSPFEGSVTRRQPILGHDGPQTQPLSDLLLVSCIEYDSLILHHRSHNWLCGTFDVTHPTLVALCADTLHCKSRCVLPAPFLIYLFLGTFRPSSMNTHNDFAWLRRRRLGPLQDAGCPKRDKMLRGSWRLATEDASSPRWWHDPIHDRCVSAETEDPEKARDSDAQAKRLSPQPQEGGEDQTLNPAPPLPSTSPPEHLF